MAQSTPDQKPAAPDNTAAPAEKTATPDNTAAPEQTQKTGILHKVNIFHKREKTAKAEKPAAPEKAKPAKETPEAPGPTAFVQTSGNHFNMGTVISYDFDLGYKWNAHVSTDIGVPVL